MLNNNFIILNNSLYLGIDYDWTLWIEVTPGVGQETSKTSYVRNEHLFLSFKVGLNVTLLMVVYILSSKPGESCQIFLLAYFSEVYFGMILCQYKNFFSSLLFFSIFTTFLLASQFLSTINNIPLSGHY